VLVGVGTAQRDADHSGAEVEAIDLMVEAAGAALDDAAGGPGPRRRSLLSSVDLVAVPEGDWAYADPGRLVAGRVGAARARTVRVEVGVAQSTPLRVAAERIRRGVIGAALVVGGEAKATRLRAIRSGREPHETDQGSVEPDERWSPSGEIMAEPEITAGLWDPVAQYACIDNALRYTERRTIEEHRDEIAALWAGFNRVATRNPLAAFPEPRTAEWLREFGSGNRLLAFPYAKWHSTQWAVDQAGAVLLCSAGTARAAGVPSDRWVFPRLLLDSSHLVSLSRRRELHRWPAMAVLGDAACRHLGRPLSGVDHAEVYSCFPAAVRVQQRELGLPLDDVPTLTGGMPFAGGPFNNFTYQATAAVVGAVRSDPGSLGLVTTVSGLLTKPGLAVWSTDPGPGEPLLADLGSEAAAMTGVVAVTGEHRGSAVIATLTLLTGRDSDDRVFVIADLPDGRRWVGRGDASDFRERIMDTELIGRKIEVRGDVCRLA
jgi:acetyl-CoA C-acetyltransferase